MKRRLAVASGIVVAVAAAIWIGRGGPPETGTEPRGKRHDGTLRWTGGPDRDLAPVAVDPEIRVAGRVIDAVDGHAIEGAIVTLRTRDGEELDAMVSDDAGEFAFEDAGGAQVVAASAEGYGIHAEALGRVTDEIVLELDGSVTVSGEVVSPAGSPVAGAEVWIEDYERIWREPPVVSSSVRSDAEGRFVIRDAPSGTLIARAMHPDFAKGETRIGGVGSGRTRENVRIELRETGALSGRVTRADGAPASGASVSWYTSAPDRWRDVEVSATTTAAADGRYRFAHLPEGRGFVRATTDSGEGAAAAGIEIDREATADVVVQEGAVFAGVVVDANGRPVAGAHVAPEAGEESEIDEDDEDDESERRGDEVRTRRRAKSFLRSMRQRDPGARTGPDGTFRFHAPLKGEVRIGAQAPGGYGFVMAQAGSTSIRITLQTLGTVRIRTVAADGSRHRSLVIASYRGTGARGVTRIENGEALLDLPVGEYEFFAGGEEESGATVHARVVTAPALTDVTLVIPGEGERTARVRGRVAGPDGSAAVGARVSIAGAGNRDWGGARGARLDWDRTVRADSSGRFSLEAPPGAHELFVYHPEMRADVVSVVVPAQGEVDAGVIRLQAGEGASAIFEFSGIGAVLRLDEQSRCAVQDVVKGGPAERAGVRAGDVFLEVDGATLHGMELGDVIERIRGPVGTTVTLLVERPGNLEPILFEVVREKIRA